MLQSTNTVLLEKVYLPLNLVIDAPRVSLRPIHPFFAYFIYYEYTDEISQCMYRQPCATYSDTRLRVLEDIKQMIERKIYTFIICENEKGNPVGCATLHCKKASPKIELWIAKQYQQKGYGSEAILALTMFAKSNLPSHKYLTVIVSAENNPAIRLMNTFGAERRPHITYKTNEAGEKGKLLTYRLYH